MSSFAKAFHAIQQITQNIKWSFKSSIFMRFGEQVKNETVFERAAV